MMIFNLVGQPNCGSIDAAAGCVETDASRDGLRCMHTNCGDMGVTAGCVEIDGGRDGL
jgi:hypothetical protein